MKHQGYQKADSVLSVNGINDYFRVMMQNNDILILNDYHQNIVNVVKSCYVGHCDAIHDVIIPTDTILRYIVGSMNRNSC